MNIDDGKLNKILDIKCKHDTGLLYQGVQRRMILMFFFRIFLIKVFCFVFAIYDPVRDVEVLFPLPFWTLFLKYE